MLETLAETNESHNLRKENQELREDNEWLRDQVQRLEQESNEWRFKYYAIMDGVRGIAKKSNELLVES